MRSCLTINTTREIPVIPAVCRLTQEDHSEVQASVGYIGRPCLKNNKQTIKLNKQKKFTFLVKYLLVKISLSAFSFVLFLFETYMFAHNDLEACMYEIFIPVSDEF